MSTANNDNPDRGQTSEYLKREQERLAQETAAAQKAEREAFRKQQSLPDTGIRLASAADKPPIDVSKLGTNIQARKTAIETSTNLIEIPHPDDSDEDFGFKLDNRQKTVDQFQKLEYVSQKFGQNLVITIPLFSPDNTFVIKSIGPDRTIEYFEITGDNANAAAIATREKTAELLKVQERNPIAGKNEETKQKIVFNDATQETFLEQTLIVLNNYKKQNIFEITLVDSKEESRITFEFNREEHSIKIKNAEKITDEILTKILKLQTELTKRLKYPAFSLKFENCDLYGITKPDEIKKLFTGIEVSFVSCLHINAQAIQSLLHSRKLREITLSYSLFDEKALREALEFNPNIRRLNLSGNGTNITDQTISHLFTDGSGKPLIFTNLEEINISDSAVTDKTLDLLLARCPKLVTINVSGTKVTQKQIFKLMALDRPLAIQVSKNMLQGTDLADTQPTFSKTRLTITEKKPEDTEEEQTGPEISPDYDGRLVVLKDDWEKVKDKFTDEEKDEQIGGIGENPIATGVIVGFGKITDYHLTNYSGNGGFVVLTYKDSRGEHDIQIGRTGTNFAVPDETPNIKKVNPGEAGFYIMKLIDGKLYIINNTEKTDPPKPTKLIVYNDPNQDNRKILTQATEDLIENGLAYPSQEQTNEGVPNGSITGAPEVLINEYAVAKVPYLTRIFLESLSATTEGRKRIFGYANSLFEKYKTYLDSEDKDGNVDTPQLAALADNLSSSLGELQDAEQEFEGAELNDDMTFQNSDYEEHWSIFKKFCFRRERELPGFTKWAREKITEYNKELNSKVISRITKEISEGINRGVPTKFKIEIDPGTASALVSAEQVIIDSVKEVVGKLTPEQQQRYNAEISGFWITSNAINTTNGKKKVIGIAYKDATKESVIQNVTYCLSQHGIITEAEVESIKAAATPAPAPKPTTTQTPSGQTDTHSENAETMNRKAREIALDISQQTGYQTMLYRNVTYDPQKLSDAKQDIIDGIKAARAALDDKNNTDGLPIIHLDTTEGRGLTEKGVFEILIGDSAEQIKTTIINAVKYLAFNKIREAASELDTYEITPTYSEGRRDSITFDAPAFKDKQDGTKYTTYFLKNKETNDKPQYCLIFNYTTPPFKIAIAKVEWTGFPKNLISTEPEVTEVVVASESIDFKDTSTQIQRMIDTIPQD